METFLNDHLAQLLETAACLAAFILLKLIARASVRSAIVRSSFKSKEEREVMRLIRLLLVVLLAIGLIAIWGVKQNEILLFATSAVTVLGVALFAEMSILSNITACLVLFFQHPVKLGDRIRLKDGDHDVEGELVDITYFFTFVRRPDGSLVTLPNSVMLKGPVTIIEGSRA